MMSYLIMILGLHEEEKEASIVTHSVRVPS